MEKIIIYEEKNRNVELSVAIPCYNGKKIV